jgi:hypothetical protein
MPPRGCGRRRRQGGVPHTVDAYRRLTEADHVKGLDKMLVLIASREEDRQQYGNLRYPEPIVTPKSLKPKTVKQYKGMWRTSLEFCIEAGFYEAGIIFARGICPSRPPTVPLVVAKLIVHFHCNPKDEILCYPGTEHPVLSGCIGSIGQPIRSVGTWKSPSAIDTFRGALAYVHTCYARTNVEYSKICGECCERPRADMGCSDHAGNPCLTRRGNPARSRDFKTFINVTKDELDHVGKTNLQLLPHELRKLRELLLSRNTLFDTMIWTIIIVSVKAFLRSDEGLNLEMKDFKRQYFQVALQKISRLCFEVKGKTDPHPVKLAVNDDLACSSR